MFEFPQSGEINSTISEPNIPNYSYFTTFDQLDLSYQDHSDMVVGASPWEALGFGDQILRNEDGSVFNLSIINLVPFYEYETSNSSGIDYGHVTPGRTVALATFVFIFIVGLLGNGLVVYTVARYATMRRVTYLYLMNLSVAHIMYLLVCLPTLSVSYALVEWRFGRVFCKLENYVMSVSMAVSVMTIVPAGVDHYMAVMYQKKYRTSRTAKKTVFQICFTWILSSAIMALRIPIFDEISVFHDIGRTTLCSRVASSQILKVDTVLSFVFLYLLPLIVLGACHFRVGRNLWNGRSSGATANALTGKFTVRNKRRVTRIMFAIATVFAIGWLPIHVYHFAEDFGKDNVLFWECIDRDTVGLFFSFGAHALNPVIYYLLSSSAGKHVKKAFRCENCKPMTTDKTDDDMASVRLKLNQEKEHKYWRPSTCLSHAMPLILHPLSPGKAIFTPGLRLTLTMSSTIPHLEPLLPNRPELHDSNCRSLSDRRPDSWPSVKEGNLIRVLSCSCGPFTNKNDD